ncbi:FimB/Mfa2 family fimbrial subunit [Bacteroides timonensis]|uniref:FimB/Mfa2 family fimbrial subunit n=1 Tax=Bacteroides timonensis TaxID=1470345 RepID=UPI0004B737CD|nr:FimB/Mfa2 family fimbrial subunit [Bacteroides timonensis]
MKRLIAFAAIAAIVASCSDDNPAATPDEALITPPIYTEVENGGGQTLLTGILTIAPCEAGSSIYYGNYINGMRTPVHAYYHIQNGIFDEQPYTTELSLPTGLYNLIYWGTSQVTDSAYYSNPIQEPAFSIGRDMSLQSYGLRQMPADTLYYPAYDMLHAVQPADIGTEVLSASLQRVVAGLQVIVKSQDGEALNPGIDSIAVRITNIYSQLNYYTGQPQGNACTVSFPLTLSADGMQMSNETAMLFPSAGLPVFQLSVILKNGTVQTFQQTLSAPLVANTKLTLMLSMGDIFSEESSGNFTVENWNEESQEINIPTLG